MPDYCLSYKQPKTVNQKCELPLNHTCCPKYSETSTSFICSLDIHLLIPDIILLLCYNLSLVCSYISYELFIVIACYSTSLYPIHLLIIQSSLHFKA